MRSIIFYSILFASTSLFAQSKKELQAEVKKLRTEIEELKKPKETDLSNIHKKASYGLGVFVAMNLQSQGGDSLDLDALTAGIKDVFGGDSLKIDKQEAMTIVQEYMQNAMEQKMNKVKKESQDFLESNKKNDSVQVTASGLQYKVVKKGSGKSPGPNDNVTVHYTGKLTDGTVFDSSVERGEPATFGVSQVIPGWTEAMQLMQEGDKWILYIPSELGYGERGAGGQIPPHAALVFEVELLKVN